MPHVRNFYYRSIECPMCKKKISKNSNRWFCCKECEEEWKLLNGDLRQIYVLIIMLELKEVTLAAKSIFSL